MTTIRGRYPEWAQTHDTGRRSMRTLTAALIPTSLATLTVLAGAALSGARHRRLVRRRVDDYLGWIFTQLEES